MKNSFILYADAYDSIRSLTTAQKGQLLDAVFTYHRGEDMPTLDPVVDMAFSFMRRMFDRDAHKYAERCEKAKLSAKKRWDANACERIKRNAKHADNDNVSVNDHDTVSKDSKDKESACAPLRESRPRFVPPSIDDITAYCVERKNGLDPQSFFDFYAAKGWSIGKNPMKDWKAAVRTWEGRRREESGTAPAETRKSMNLDDMLAEARSKQ